jgi:hypothetical protein
LSNFLHSPVTSSLLGPNILLRTIFSNTFSLCPSLSVRYQGRKCSRYTNAAVLQNKLLKDVSSHTREYINLSIASCHIPEQYKPISGLKTKRLISKQ